MNTPITSSVFRYFAYGSNMLTQRLNAEDRAPSARPLSTGFIEGRRLSFDKLGKDGSGKCDAEPTGNRSHRVYGVVFEVGRHEEHALDLVEGLGWGYAKRLVHVTAAAGLVEAMTYVAKRKDRLLRPYHWYKEITIAGALEHGLPPEYIESLRAIESIEDHDRRRRAVHEALLSN
jgi:gamma-glutamylcyclotransferase (GGCT)/AIG2-like uncharacterized protein YtfP